MKKSRIFYAVGTLVLTVGGFIATMANKKFTTYEFVKVNGVLLVNVTLAAADHFTTIKGLNSRTAFFATRNGITITLHTLVTYYSRAKQIYYK